uniref:SUEL-type lectin domain-containing protein n=1 Tax=Mola mola TaxID=94237 RepID=A0A3Q3WGG1_MOLML
MCQSNKLSQPDRNVCFSVLAATCFLTAAGKYGSESAREPAERIVTCENDFGVHRLSCERGVISVQAALYGRADTQTCSNGRPAHQLTNTQCSQPGTVNVLRKRCDGKKVCTFKYVDTTYTCNPAIHRVICEHSFAYLFCDEGQVIHVNGADYGRRDQTTCSSHRPASQLQNVYCSSPAGNVGERCNGKNSCVVSVSNSVFGDPCVGTFKYLEVAYTCLYSEIS